MKALISGATGFTGKKLIQRLLNDEDYAKVYALVRQEMNLKHPKLTQLKINFENLSEQDIPESIDIAFCCLGTTIKKAQSKKNFRKVDYEYIIRFAKLCETCSVTSFHLISAIGANPGSPFFYQQIKGEAECFINSLDFESVVIYRPSVLYGGRDEFRFFESFAAWISRNFDFLFVGQLKRMRAVTGDQLAAVMHKKSKKTVPGRWIIESEEISCQA